jgi:hypothetical protein
LTVQSWNINRAIKSAFSEAFDHWRGSENHVELAAVPAVPSGFLANLTDQACHNDCVGTRKLAPCLFPLCMFLDCELWRPSGPSGSKRFKYIHMVWDSGSHVPRNTSRESGPFLNHVPRNTSRENWSVHFWTTSRENWSVHFWTTSSENWSVHLFSRDVFRAT